MSSHPFMVLQGKTVVARSIQVNVSGDVLADATKIEIPLGKWVLEQGHRMKLKPTHPQWLAEITSKEKYKYNYKDFQLVL